MPRNRSRNYALSDQDIIQILDFDDSDEEGLLEVDNEDLDFLWNSNLYECDIYVGKKNCTTEVGLSENVVMQLMKSLSNIGCRLFIVNFYTSPALGYKLI